MKYRKNRKLRRTSEHRIALMRNMSASLIENESVKTTLAKAKEVSKFVSKLITRAKKGDLASRRAVARDIRTPVAFEKLFGPLAERFKDRPGGYTRIYRLATRISDGSKMAVIKLVE
jgi:large subunit ribosomal protein L17